MNIFYKNYNFLNLLLIFLIFFSFLTISSYSKSLNQDFSKNISKSISFEIPIRVLIEENKLEKGKLLDSSKSAKSAKNILSWSFKSDKGFIIIFPKDKKRYTLKNKFLDIKINFANNKSNNKFNNKKLNKRWRREELEEIFIMPIEGFLELNNSKYYGLFAINKTENSIYLVNHLELEDYVSTVLPSETWPTWPDEVNYALSVCIRSYGIAKILEGRDLFDVKNTTAHLVYKGSNNPEKLKKIVQKTKNIVLAHKNRPILAMFDISCGGIITSQISGINFKKAPYLSRSYACTYCKSYKCFSWEKSYSFSELKEIIGAVLPNIKKIDDIQISATDPAGIVLELKIRENSCWHKIKVDKLKCLFNFKSLYFDLELKKDKKNIHSKSVNFKGKGFGHLIGLCQFGLSQMIKEGWDYKSALKFFYPNTQFMKLVKQDKSFKK